MDGGYDVVICALVDSLVANKIPRKKRAQIYEDVVYLCMYQNYTDKCLEYEKEALGKDPVFDKFYFEHNVSDCYECGRKLNPRNVSDDMDMCRRCYLEELEDEYEDDDDGDCLVRV